MKLLLSFFRHPAADVALWLFMFLSVLWDLNAYWALVCGAWGVLTLQRWSEKMSHDPYFVIVNPDFKEATTIVDSLKAEERQPTRAERRRLLRALRHLDPAATMSDVDLDLAGKA